MKLFTVQNVKSNYWVVSKCWVNDLQKRNLKKYFDDNLEMLSQEVVKVNRKKKKGIRKKPSQQFPNDDST